MKAIVCRGYGPPEALELAEVPTPEPKDGQVRVRVHAASVNQPDAFMISGTPWLSRLFMGLRRPKWPIPGSDIAGTVDAVGPGVTAFAPGDAVYGDLSSGAAGFGGFAEYAVAPVAVLAPKPASLTFEHAAAAPMAVSVALQGLCDRAPVEAGQRVLVVGASGGIGTYAVQIAKSLGAVVTGVCGPSSGDLVRSLGADEIIDYTTEDFADRGEAWDFILAIKGHRPLSTYKRALRPGGTYLMAGGTMRQVFAAMLLGRLRSSRQKTLLALQLTPGQNDLPRAAEMFDAGVLRSTIDRTLPLDEAARALAHYQSGHAHGKIVLRVRES